MSNIKPEIIIIAGANGVGKTTFAKPYVQKIGYKFLNADEIAKRIEYKGVKNVMVKAGRIFFAELEVSLNQRQNIVIETTLSGSYINKLAVRARKNGYHLKMIYIFVDNEDLCVERVRSRVLKGGHHVPEEDIRRRFQRSLQNFWQNFTALADSWILLYNGEENYKQVAIGNSYNYSVEDIVRLNYFKSILKSI